jgi:hypothetical protein
MNANDVQAALDAALKTQVELDPSDPYQKVVQDFVGHLNAQAWLQAAVRPVAGGKAPGALRVILWPRYQRSMATTLHTIFLQGGRARVVGGSGGELASPAALEEHLVASLGHPSVIETLREFRRMSAEDVEGYLRVKNLRALTVNDVSVIVPHAEQVKLADAAEAGGKEIELRVQLLRPPPLGKYQQDADYRFLKAGGYAMALQARTEPIDDRTVKVVGTALSPDETPAVED